MKFSDIPTRIKLWGTAFLTTVAIVTTVIIWVSYLQTDAEAAVHVRAFVDYQEQQYKSDKYDRVDRIVREIDRIDYQLLDEELSDVKRRYLENKRDDLEAKIECIRADTC